MLVFYYVLFRRFNQIIEKVDIIIFSILYERRNYASQWKY